MSRFSIMTCAILLCLATTLLIYVMIGKMPELQNRQDYQICQACIIVMGFWDVICFATIMHCFFDNPKEPPKIRQRRESSQQELDDKKQFDQM